jgi:hypothetical protein
MCRNGAYASKASKLAYRPENGLQKLRVDDERRLVFARALG